MCVSTCLFPFALRFVYCFRKAQSSAAAYVVCVYVQIMYARLCVCMWQRVVGQLLAAFLPFVAAEFSTQLALFMYILCMYTCINRTT